MENLQVNGHQCLRLVNISTLTHVTRLTLACVIQVSELCTIEGRNLKDSARRMLDRVLKNSLMSKFNMKGGDPLQKEAFEKTALFSVIRDAVMTNFPAATELDLRNAVGKHFKQEIKPLTNNFL